MIFFPDFFVVMFPAGADATETSCQPVETEHGLKVGVFPKGKLPPTVCHASTEARRSGSQTSLRIPAFAVTGDVVANNEKDKLRTAAQQPPIET